MPTVRVHVSLSSLLVMMLTFTGGCVRYEYDIVRPSDLSRHVGADRDTVARVPPLEYRLRSVDNYLVMRIFNLTREPVTLLGDQSFSVDPHGQSHPLQGQTIAPGTYIKLIFPPPRPQLEPTGPTIGFGVGARFGSAYHYGYHRGYWGYDPLYEPHWDTPRYYTVYDANAIYWDWSGESDVRLSMSYQSVGQKPFTHEWVFHRRRV